MNGPLSYSNEKQVNIIPQENFEQLTQEVFGTIADNLSKSLGPLGSSATILDGMMTGATKDGYNILSKYTFLNKYKRMIYNLILAPCTVMNNTVGDATTTVIVLTDTLLNRYRANKNRFDMLCRLPRQFSNAWDIVVDALTERVRNEAKPINMSDDSIYHLAYVTSNGNEQLSRDIANIYKECPNPTIKRKDSPTNRSYVEKINGYSLDCHLISDGYAKNEDMSVSFDDVAVAILNFKVDNDVFEQFIKPMNAVYLAMNKRFVVLAPAYDHLLVDTEITRYTNAEFRSPHGINLILNQYDASKFDDENELKDLSIILNGKILSTDDMKKVIGNPEFNPDKLAEDTLGNKIAGENEEDYYRWIGYASHASLSIYNGAIFTPKDIENNEAYYTACAQAKIELDNIAASVSNDQKAYSLKIYHAEKRISRLNMNTYIYYVGANSSLQKQILDDSVDDVIKCIKSAVKHGTVPGCQLTLIEAAKEYMKSFTDKLNNNQMREIDFICIEVASIIIGALIDTYHRVLTGPDGMGILRSLCEWPKTSGDEQQDAELWKAFCKDGEQKATEVIDESIRRHQVFDIENLEYSDNIITSAETDIMVLKSAAELIKILVTSNQCVYISPEVTDAHQEKYTDML